MNLVPSQGLEQQKDTEFKKEHCGCHVEDRGHYRKCAVRNDANLDAWSQVGGKWLEADRRVKREPGLL